MTLELGNGGNPLVPVRTGVYGPSLPGALQAPLLDQGGQVYNVKAYGAKGDGTTNDWTAIAAAIAAAGINGTVVFPLPSSYYKVASALVPLDGQLWIGPNSAPVSGTNLKIHVKADAAYNGYLIDTTTLRNVTIQGLNFEGNTGAGSGGIRLAGSPQRVKIKVCGFNQFGEQAIVIAGGNACAIEDVYAQNAVLVRSRSSVIGAIDVSGSDHWMHRVEATISGSAEGTVQSSSLWCVGISWKANNGFLHACVGEISDVGIHVSGTRNRISDCRGDLNYGHGFMVTGGSNQFPNCLGLNNSQDTTNTYSNFHATSASANNQYANCQGNDTLTKKAKYGFEDLIGTDSNKNQYVNCRSITAVTAQFFTPDGVSAAMAPFPAANLKTLTANSTTPDVTGYERFITANSSPTTITNFTGGVQGQTLYVLCNDANTSIGHSGSGTFTPNAGTVKLVSGRIYVFTRHSTAWRMHPFQLPQVGADVGDAAKTIQWGVDESTQRWNTAITANRAVTLSTTGATNGARFRIVREAGCTGAFNINVGTGPLKALTAAATWCDVEYDGSAWRLTAAGSL